MFPAIAHVNLAKGFRGGERQTELVIDCLADKGVRQILVCRDSSPMREHLSQVKNLKFIDAKHQLQGHLTISRFVDVLHAHEPKALHWAWIHHRLFGLPYIVTRRVTHNVRNTAFNRACYKDAARIVAISSIIQQQLLAKGWGDVGLIHSAFARLGYDSQHTSEIRQRYKGKFLIGHAGALVDAHKGQREIIAAAGIVRQSTPDAHFILLGEGPDGESLRTESQHLENLEWLGFQSSLGDYVAAMDIFIFPSRYEGLGSTLLDVMDLCVPIAASDVDGIPDLVKHEVTGLLFPPNDAAALASSILRLYRDVSLRSRLALNAKNSLTRFSPENMAERYLQMYTEALVLGGAEDVL